ncbi:hypothetical protein ACFW1P_02630 [Paenibacillus sp. NPDC058910]|uniref:hypothetical protein n=1 Tax=unclassified Paenibacillus TaxID=185978 RepID=UPI0036C05E3B
MKKQKQMTTERKKEKDYLIVCVKKEDYKLIDIRTNKPIYFQSDPLGSYEESGSAVFQEIDSIQFNTKINGRKNTLEYFSPNSVGLLLSVSNKSLMQAKSIYNEKINPDKVNHFAIDERNDRIDNLTHKSQVIFDYIELIQTSIVFGYTALEAFVNLSIPDDYLYSEKNSKGINEIYDKEAIERWLSLKVKLSEILVSIYETKPIKQLQLWTGYNQFEEYRNEIIHQKSVNHTNFYKKYFNKNIFDLCNVSEDVIKFFFDERSTKDQTNPLWPWVINANNDFPSRILNSANVEITGNIYEGKFKK